VTGGWWLVAGGWWLVAGGCRAASVSDRCKGTGSLTVAARFVRVFWLLLFGKGCPRGS
jgi:uncharacterized sodium:solute symporter family permease YidK